MIDTLISTLSSPLVIIACMFVIGVTLIMLVFAGRGNEVPDPLEKIREQRKSIPERETRRLVNREDNTLLQRKLAAFKEFLEPSDEDELTEARQQMIQAGFHGRNAVRDYHAAKFILAVIGIFLGLSYILLFPPGPESSILATLLPVMIPTLIGYYVPIYWVTKRRQERQIEIQRGFPDALDMLLICTEAGQSMDQSIARVAHELKAAYPALAEEFDTVAHETKAGKDRLEVLKDMGERCGNADIRSFATVLIQSATYGTSVADALRVYASEMRDKRVMLAEEKANVLPTKLTLGTMMFTVPPLLIILIAPSIYGVMTMLATADFGL